jgi:pimeloyl-ACP methyl ester carboxylesterase
MSHPFKGLPGLPFNTLSNPTQVAEKHNIYKALAELPEPRKHYRLYLSSSLAVSDMDNPKEPLADFLRGYFYLKSADWKGNDPKPLKAWEATEFSKMPYYYVMPLKSTMREAVNLLMAKEDASTVSELTSRWLDDKDLAIYVQEFGRNGFQGGLNWYRVSTNPHCMKDVELFAGRTIDVPIILISGAKDWGTYQEPGALEEMAVTCSHFKGAKMVEGAGHWVQQEQPEMVVKLVTDFLKEVNVDAMSY